MRVATWNINGVRARKECLLRWLLDEEQKPDVVAIQKIRASEEVFREELGSILNVDRLSRVRSADYYARVWCRKGEYGVAILSTTKSVLCGDFNVSTERRGKTRNPKTENEELRRKFSALCEQGFIDLYMEPSEGKDRFTYNGRQGDIKLTKLQYMLGTVSVADRLRGAPTVAVEYRRPGAGNAWWAPLVAELDD